MAQTTTRKRKRRVINPVLQGKAPQKILAVLGEWVKRTTNDPQSIIPARLFLVNLHIVFVVCLAEEAAPEEDENEENPFATEFQEDQEAAYLKDPKKALQGFYDREGKILTQDK